MIIHKNVQRMPMRILFVLISILFISIDLFSQTIPSVETTFSIHKKEKQQFSFFLQKGYLLKAILIQKGIDLSISVYKKNDSTPLALFDSPNGENGPEPIAFESQSTGDYILVIEQLSDDSVLEGKYSLRQIYVQELKAKSDSSFAKGSRVVIGPLSKSKIDNLVNLAMLWGFLKYHHPSVARCDYNWDAELFRVLPRLLSARTKTEANAVLENWVDKIGKPDPCTTCKITKNDSSVNIMPDYGYLFNEGNLSVSLVTKLNYIKNNRNQEENYYVSLAGGIGNPVFDHEAPYAKMIYPDAGYRLLSLFRYWNIIQYFFPYKYLIGEDWNKILSEFIPRFVLAKDATQYTLACLEIIARVHDSHANVWGNNKILNEYFGNYQAPVQAAFAENKLIVTGYYADTFSIKEKLRIGDVITKINGVPVDLLVKNKLYLIAASNYEKQLAEIPNRALLRGKSGSLPFEIIRDNKIKLVNVPCVDATRLNRGRDIMAMDFNPFPNDSSYRIINGNIGYVFPGRYKDSQLAGIKKTFEKTRGMIIDMRTYPSEFMPFSFGHYIKPNSSPFVKFTVGDVSNPGLFTFGQLLSNGEPNPDYYKGPIVEIVNSITMSQAEYTTMAFQTAPDLTVIGSITAGADGNVSPITLPGGISTLISGIGVYYPDGRETQRKGIQIDQEVRPTVEGIKQGRDELLERAIELIKSKSSVKGN